MGCCCEYFKEEKQSYVSIPQRPDEDVAGQTENRSPLDEPQPQQPQTAHILVPTDDKEKEIEIDGDMVEDTREWQEYKAMMRLAFYTFAGYQPWAKVTGLYMHQKELQSFLEIVEIDDPVQDVFTAIDATDIQDGRLTFNEWMDYFTNHERNDQVYAIREHIEDTVTWQLLVKALKIFQTVDADHSGKLEYGEFERFGAMIGYNAEETEQLWHALDTNASGAIDITELFEWFRVRLYQQRQRITANKQASIQYDQADIEQLRETKSNPNVH